jgi:CDP-glucose 4,6-dehydratase|tara:strand:+ start:6098 stop:7201 length:1104 start_codon:yes stop_codon:yes gene_type:complete
MTRPFANVYDGKRILVTGHTGFKGSWLTLWLNHLGADVTGYSDEVPASPSVFELLGLETRIDHRLGDIRNRDRLARVLDDVRPDMVLHLAAQALVLQSHLDPVGTFETNTMGMVNLLECIRERPWIEVAVLVTSDKAYRNEEWQWGYRETDYLGGHDPYSGSKSCAELVAHSYFHSFLRDSPTRIATARAGNVIGGGDWATDRIVPDCIRAWSMKETVSVRRPESTRPWQHVLEPLSGYLWLGAQLWNSCEHLDGEAFNFGPPPQQDMTVADLLRTMAERWPGAGWQEVADSAVADREATLLRLSCDKALRQLDWHAVMQFPSTVTLTIDWYRAWQEAEVDIHDFTINQIEQYTDIASTAGVAWSCT